MEQINGGISNRACMLMGVLTAAGWGMGPEVGLGIFAGAVASGCLG
jgi:hypothetical protein